MHASLQRNIFFVKEHVGLFKAANNYDILDPQSKEKLLECREEKLGFITKILRFTKYKRMTPFDIDVRSVDGQPVINVNRGISIFLSNVSVQDETGHKVGGFKQKFFSIGGAFRVLDANEQEVCQLKGKWTSWDFRFMRGDEELAHVSKKWAGLGKELLTSADNYVLEISEQLDKDDSIRQLILAAVLCIDMVLKE